MKTVESAGLTGIHGSRRAGSSTARGRAEASCGWIVAIFSPRSVTTMGCLLAARTHRPVSA
jgi:hypothetical protein